MTVDTAVLNGPEEDVLAGWMEGRRSRSRARGHGRCCTTAMGGLRFAFYGRVSTEDFQDRVSSRSWQREAASELIAGRGAIVAEFFDVGHSRSRAWGARPQAAALLAELADAGRGFDAVVVGEYERAFYGTQLRQIAPLLAQHGVELWLPETEGPVDHRSPTHQALIMLLGAQSKREVLRSRFRTTAAMQAQAREQGRYLGGRPPYGYRLGDAGAHPNAAHARWGRRLHKLEPDPDTAPHVKWMFAQRLTGRSVASIARELNDRAVLCPSGVDPDRNPHRTGTAWTLRTVASILSNPRYTGRQVWNRQRSGGDPQDSAEGRSGEVEVRRWNSAQDWVISKKIVHAPLVSEADFIGAQTISAISVPQDGSSRTYLLVGLLRCRVCGRRMESHWVHSRPGYRCRHGHTSAKPAVSGRPKTLYLREDHILARIALQLDHLKRPDQTGHAMTCHDPDAIAQFLRTSDMMITCDVDSCTLDTDATSTSPTQQAMIT